MIIDLDRLSEWPQELLTLLRKHKQSLIEERVSQHAYNLAPSTYRMVNRRPAKPSWDGIISYIQEESKNWRIRVFHATRLLNFEDVKREGLKQLDLAKQAELVRKALTDKSAPEEVISSFTLTPAILEFLPGREGLVFFTPIRRALHDGGCEVFFEHFGGEAIERMAGMAGETSLKFIQSLGMPAVVIANIPATGCCEFADGRFPQTLIELFLEAEGGIEPMDYGWDVMVKADIPPEWIEAVVPVDDPSVI